MRPTSTSSSEPGAGSRILALTAGEPAGIGPDLCLAVAGSPRAWPVVCLAGREVLADRARQLGLDVRLHEYRPDVPPTTVGGELTVLHVPVAAPVVAGRLDQRNARHVLALIDRAVDGCRAREFAAMVTAPVHKGIINDAGIAFSGHTEYIAARTLTPQPVMLLAAGGLRVALATTHLPLRAVSDALSAGMIEAVLRILHAALQHDFGCQRPQIAVCGLNPHAGESGHLGDEERRIIAPALAAARAAGIDAAGPFPADTLFVPHQRAGYDAILAMYHDQGLPVLKAAGFGEAVNVTLGLPIVRTSVDHGTALELAGGGQADSGSLRAALALAAAMAEQRA
ncbi:MAG: 4-hydroxythreonine-4-phosphate dehydrogenase PdxA [Gammaproteobacteria bacterium]|nr:4-hydroxythreonine-4-phosphate dehydrogenase PdxA [Gammaproteobacteria bacterium]